MTGLCVTKLDVLAELPQVSVCVGYKDGVTPGRDGFERAVPVYETLQGWGDPELKARLCAAKDLAGLPAPVRAYLDQISEFTNTPVTLIGIGADRSQTICVSDPF